MSEEEKKLKTLKYLKHECKWRDISTDVSKAVLVKVNIKYAEADLKNVAIAWIKALDSDYPIASDFESSDISTFEASLDLQKLMSEDCIREAIIEWIKYFFNITEKDLKK